VHLQQTKSRHLFAPTHQVQIGDNPRSDLLKPLAGQTLYRAGGIITNVCVASAIFCSRLETKEFETSVSAQKKLHARAASPPVTIRLTEREKNIWNVIQRMSKGRQYCREVDGANIRIQRTGVWKGAPPTYIAAYDAGKPWRHRIEDEKSKIKRKAELAQLATKLAGE
jgi:hypothetical protein